MTAIVFMGLLLAQTLTADELRSAGLVRIADVLRLAEGWDVASIEGFTLRATPPGNPLPERVSYAVFIDDVFVPLDQLGTTHVNRLPLSLEDVERVTIDSSPVVIRGRFAPGAFRIETRRPASPLELRARHVAGSETGDPGPYQFTELASPNVERFGFDSDGSLAARAGGVQANAGYRSIRHYASDPFVLDRYVAIAGSEFRVLEGGGPSARAQWVGERVNAAVFVRTTGIDDSYFLRPNGREIPVENGFEQFGASGRWHARENLDVDATVTSTSNELDASGRGGVPALDWRTEAKELDVRASACRGPLAATLGGRVTLHEAHARTDIRDDEWTGGGVSVRLERADSSGAATSLDLMFEQERGENASAFAASHRRQWRRGTFGLALSAARMLPEPASPFWFWREQGLSVLEEEGVAVDADGTVQRAGLFAADVGASTTLGTRVTLEADLFLRATRDAALEDERFQYDPDAETFTSPVALRTDEAGETAGGTLAAMGVLSATTRVRASWRYQDAIGGSALYRDAVRAVPRHAARLTFSTTPFRNFDVECAVRARSASHWIAYEDVGAQSGGRYDDRIPGWGTVDVAFRKWLAGRHLRFGVAFRNLLDREVRTHPIGEDEALTVIVEGAIDLAR